MKSANLFVRITVAILFSLSTFGAFGSESIAAGANRCKDRCNRRYHERKRECHGLRKFERRQCEERAKFERDECRRRCR